MSTIHLVGDRRLAYVKGAAEVLVPRTTLPPDEQAAVLHAAAEMERSAFRVLAFARRVLPDGRSRTTSNASSSSSASRGCSTRHDRSFGGDSSLPCGRNPGAHGHGAAGTAEAVARRIGLQDAARVIGPADLDALDDEGCANSLPSAT
jgi:magnesium-transporting ATPase (P-type)